MQLRPMAGVGLMPEPSRCLLVRFHVKAPFAGGDTIQQAWFMPGAVLSCSLLRLVFGLNRAARVKAPI
jgi:hypothetical protein